MFEMMAGRSPFDIVGSSDNPDQNTEDYLFQGNTRASVVRKKTAEFMQHLHVDTFLLASLNTRNMPSVTEISVKPCVPHPIILV